MRFGRALVYLDDILIPSTNVEEGFENLKSALDALKEHNFTLNLSKCKFFQEKIEHLGREISKKGVRSREGKVGAVLKAPTPANVKQVRQFLGLAGNFRKFRPGYAKKVAPLTNLLRKNVPWVWGAEHSRVLEDVKQVLSERPVLVVYDPTLVTEVHTDASSIGLGAILIQKRGKEKGVVAYYSRETTAEEQKYHSYDLETLTVVVALRAFRVYLLGIKFTVVTECSAI